jgi:hypothetical protein
MEAGWQTLYIAVFARLSFRRRVYNDVMQYAYKQCAKLRRANSRQIKVNGSQNVNLNIYTLMTRGLMYSNH